jgi:hypothetical protein
VSPRALVIPHVLTPEELAGLLAIGEALADIKDRLAAMMGRPGGPIASKLADLASLTIELLDVVEPDPDEEDDAPAEPVGDDEPDLAGSHTDLKGGTADDEPSLGWLLDGRLAPARGLRDLDCEDDIADRLHDAEEPERDRQPIRLDVFPDGPFVGVRRNG